jgi:hypothetical protein
MLSLMRMVLTLSKLERGLQGSSWWKSLVENFISHSWLIDFVLDKSYALCNSWLIGFVLDEIDLLVKMTHFV